MHSVSLSVNDNLKKSYTPFKNITVNLDIATWLCDSGGMNVSQLEGQGSDTEWAGK